MSAAGRASTRRPRHRRRGDIPAALDAAAAWSWRILLVVAASYLLVLAISRLALITVPLFAALLFAALMHRPADMLRGWGVPRGLSAGAVLILGFAVLGGVGYFLADRVAANIDEITFQVNDVINRLNGLLAQLPTMGTEPLSNLQDRVLTWLQQHSETVAGQALTTGRTIIEVITGLIIALFLAFFFLAEGDRIWSWVVRLLPPRAQPSINGAGHRAWHMLSGWILGTAIIATIHGFVIGFVLWLLGTPLVIPLAVLVFIGSFIPLIGAFIFGGIAVVITLLAVGIWPALILVAVLIAQNNLVEGYLLQPLILGHAIQLHPAAIVIVLTGAGVLAGLLGLLVAVPVVGALHAAAKYLAGREDIAGRPLYTTDPMQPMTPPRTAPLARSRSPQV